MKPPRVISPRPRKQRPYPERFVFGRGLADPRELSLSGLKIFHALTALKPVRGQVLEIGSGGGQYLRALRRFRPDLEVFAVDLDPRAVAESLRVPGAVCCRADAQDLPFADHTFAAVVGFDILEHVKHPAKVLAEVRRVLKPGGLLHLYVPCEGNAGTIYARLGHRVKAEWGGHIQQFVTEQVLHLLERKGFQVIGLRHADYWLAQHFDYAFYQRLSRSPHPEKLWAGQALLPGGGLLGAFLRFLRRLASAAAWLESAVRFSRRGAMGMHVSAVKIPSAQPEAADAHGPKRPPARPPHGKRHRPRAERKRPAPARRRRGT